MTEKEIAELRRRLKPEKCNIGRIRGCLVNEKKEIVSTFQESLPLMADSESEQLLSLFKKTLSGKVGRNLTDISFTTNQVLESEQHKLLSTLRSSQLDDEEALSSFYTTVSQSLTLEGNYLILLASDVYDIFSYGKDGKQGDESSGQFRYIVCSICPLKLTKNFLSYSTRETAFRTLGADTSICAPELGFLFPAFDSRSTNIYGALYYTRDASDNHEDFASAVFNSDLPMSAGEQSENFRSLLSETAGEHCDYNLVEAFHAQVTELIEDHKESRDPEPLVLNKGSVKKILLSCGMPEENLPTFEQRFDESFGKDAELTPGNLISGGRFEVTTPEVAIKVDPEHRNLVETRIIDGVKYILIRAEDAVEVNGVGIHIHE